jgi:hypothetical protein
MAAGKRSQVIADQLFLSPKTVVQSALFNVRAWTWFDQTPVLAESSSSR